jgi:hypothetical protein
MDIWPSFLAFWEMGRWVCFARYLFAFDVEDTQYFVAFFDAESLLREEMIDEPTSFEI